MSPAGESQVSVDGMSGSADDARNSDVELMSRLSRGDAKAMNDLVHQFGPGLHRLIGRLTGWSSDTDDILQEVLLTAWRKAGTFHGRGSLEGWLHRLAVNRCRNHRRAGSAFKRLLRRVAVRSRMASGAKTTQDDIPSSLLRTALSRLGNEDRMVLALYYLEELSGGDVAELLGIQVSTVHVRLHRARRRLRALLVEEEQCDE